jgi:two-component system sensor histidine kinase YesM
VKKYSFLWERGVLFISMLFLTIGLLLLALAAGEAIVPLWRMVMVILCTVFSFGALYFGYYWLYKPYRETERMLKLFIEGFAPQDIYDLRYPPSHGMAGALKKLKVMLDTQELLTANRKQAQYLALQNQINPHFLYNTLEGIRGEAIAEGLDNVATMVETLASFFRYTISNMEQLVMLEDELENIQNYYIIQQYRFGSKIQLSVQYGDEDQERLFKCRLPKMTLQPIVENAVIHGIERKISPGHIQIKLVSTENLLIITISDDGVGIEESRLREISKKLDTTFLHYVSPDSDGESGIAIVNVNNRIRLLFGEEYGITIYSTPNVGTDVEIMLPLIIGRAAENHSVRADISEPAYCGPGAAGRDGENGK